MTTQEKEKCFSDILEILQNVKNGIILDCTEELSYTGIMPEKATKELKLLASLTGSVFSGLQLLGFELKQDPNHDSLIILNINSKIYSCAKSNLPNMDKKDLTASEAYSMVQDLKEKEVKEVKEENKITELKNDSENISVINDNSTSYAEECSTTELEDFKFDENKEIEEKFEEFEEFEEEDIISDENLKEFMENKSEDILEEINNSKDNQEFFVEETENIQDHDENDFNDNQEDILSSIREQSNISTLNHADFFTEESVKNAKNLIYSTSKITILHPDIGSKPEEILVMIAPLKVSKYSCPTVPIVVALYNRGKTVIKSSYDTLEVGKNLVQIDINEFYFLCRGSFDDNGKFNATIVTTGISANQGDKINVLSHKVYGNSKERDTINGHIKFRYNAECGPGSIEVFPFGQPGEPDYVAIVKNDEFIDYYFISKSLRSNVRPIIYTENNEKHELVCQWDNDNLIAELVER